MRKQHPQHERIVEMIEEGRSDRRIHDLLHVNRKYIRAVRADMGVTVWTRALSVDEQLSRFSSIPDPDGHIWWTGCLSTSGTPRIRIDGKEVPARHSIFEKRAGRKAVGQVRADCGLVRCVAPAHLMDDIERRKIRLQTRALLGYADHWQTCSTCGGDWETQGRVEEKLSLYCCRCSTERKTRHRKGHNS